MNKISFRQKGGFLFHCYNRLPLCPYHIIYLFALTTPVTMASLILLQAASASGLLYILLVLENQEYSFSSEAKPAIHLFQVCSNVNSVQWFPHHFESKIPSPIPTTLLLVLHILFPCFIFLHNFLIFYIIHSFYCLISVCKLHECRNCSHSACQYFI